MKKIVLYFSLILAVFVLVGCGKKNELEGTWKGATNDGLEVTIVFKSGGEMTYATEFMSESKGTYEVKDDIVTINVEAWSQAKEYKYEIKDGKLNLTAQDEYSPSYTGLVKE